MKKGGIICRFYVDGELFAERAWHAAPHVGEVIMMREDRPKVLQPGEEPKPRTPLLPYEVLGRIFMTEGGPHNYQMINYYCEKKE